MNEVFAVASSIDNKNNSLVIPKLFNSPYEARLFLLLKEANSIFNGPGYIESFMRNISKFMGGYVPLVINELSMSEDEFNAILIGASANPSHTTIILSWYRDILKETTGSTYEYYIEPLFANNLWSEIKSASLIMINGNPTKHTYHTDDVDFVDATVMDCEEVESKKEHSFSMNDLLNAELLIDKSGWRCANNTIKILN